MNTKVLFRYPQIALCIVACSLAGCAFGGNQNPLPTAIRPDASTPANLPEYNGGIIADRVIDGKPYNIVDDDVAAAIRKWQGNENGFRRVLYGGNHLWAIDKGVVNKFDMSPP
jgi:hypothetical protein